MRHTLVVCLALLSLPSVMAAQSSASGAFREYTRQVGTRLVLAAQVMPAEAYAFKATRTQSSFGELLELIDYRTRHLCARLTDQRPPSRVQGDTLRDKASQLARLHASFAWCDSILASLTDERLADSVVVDFREAFPFAPRSRTRALTMTLATAYWAESYGQVSQYVRLNGRVPPVPCGGVEDDTTSCDSGLAICRPTRRGGVPATATFTTAR